MRNALLIVLCVVSLAVAGHQPSLPAVGGVVFLDENGNGTRDGSEHGIAGVAVSNQEQVATTGQDGRFELSAGGTGVVFVSVPDGYRTIGRFWQAAAAQLNFALARTAHPAEFSFVHASDTHVSDKSVDRLERLKNLVRTLAPAFVLISGDLVRDALRVNEQEARGYYDLYAREIAGFASPVWNVPGNHEMFGIERHLSLVSPKHPLYGKAMFRHLLGPDYFSFTYGGIHFVGLDTVDIDDLWYYGHVDDVQLTWLQRDLAAVPPGTPVVTFNHIPFYSSAASIAGYSDDPPAPTLIKVNGRLVFRHNVSNARDVIEKIRTTHPYPLALGGHIHFRETIGYGTASQSTRFEQSAAVIGPSDDGGMALVSGITLYHVRNAAIDEGRFIPLD